MTTLYPAKAMPARQCKLRQRHPEKLQKDATASPAANVQAGSHLCIASVWAFSYAHPKTNTIGIHQRMFEEQKSPAKRGTWKGLLPFAQDDIAKRILAGHAISLPRISVNAPDGPMSSVFSS